MWHTLFIPCMTGACYTYKSAMVCPLLAPVILNQMESWGGAQVRHKRPCPTQVWAMLWWHWAALLYWAALLLYMTLGCIGRVCQLVACKCLQNTVNDALNQLKGARCIWHELCITTVWCVLSIYLSIYLSICLSIFLSTYLSIYLCMLCLCIHGCMYACMHVCMCVYVCVYVCLSVCMYVCMVM